MKKMTILILSLMIISGCSIKYELKIDSSSNHTETITVKGKNEELGLLSIDKWLDFYLKDSPDYLKKDLISNSTNYEVIVDSIQGDKDIYSSSLAVNRFYTLSITNYKGERTYYYKYNKKYDQDSFNNNYYDKIEFVLDSDIPLTYSNADKFEKGKYYWNFDDELSDITFSFKVSDENINSEKGFFDKYNIKPKYIEIFVGLLILTIITIIFIKHKKHNKI